MPTISGRFLQCKKYFIQKDYRIFFLFSSFFPPRPRLARGSKRVVGDSVRRADFGGELEKSFCRNVLLVNRCFEIPFGRRRGGLHKKAHNKFGRRRANWDAATSFAIRGEEDFQKRLAERRVVFCSWVSPTETPSNIGWEQSPRAGAESCDL